MISELRTYFDTQIKAVDADLEFIDDPFGDNDIDQVTSERFYKLWFGTTALTREGSFYLEEIPVTVEIYAQRDRDETASFDTVYQKAFDVKNCIVSPTDVKNQVEWTDIFAQSLEPQPLDTDDNTIKVILTFLVRREITFC